MYLSVFCNMVEQRILHFLFSDMPIIQKPLGFPQRSQYHFIFGPSFKVIVRAVGQALNNCPQHPVLKKRCNILLCLYVSIQDLHHLSGDLIVHLHADQVFIDCQMMVEQLPALQGGCRNSASL